MSEKSTTPDRVELVRQSVEGLGRFDFDAWLWVFAADVVYDASSSGVGTFKRVAALRGFATDWLGSYEEYEGRLEENDDLGNGVTFTVALWDGRLRGSVARAQERWSYTGLWEASVISRMIVRADIEEARAAAERLAEERG
ncbi:MAG TPA: hypothetical protein VKG38_08065 [Solirubrobacteraceae bacterium]|nr:hypothetical protein [Solirubrobacteraceae bacterium]